MDTIQHEAGGELFTMLHFLVISRWIHFTTLFVLFGASFFWFYMGHQGWVDGTGGLPRTRHATRILLLICAPVAAMSGIAWLAGILANMTAGFDSVIDLDTLRLFFFETGFGSTSIARLILLAAILVIVVLPLKDRTRFAALCFVSALLLINQARLGHAAEGRAGFYGALIIGVYSIHILAAAAWVGGLPPLLFALMEQRTGRPNDARLEHVPKSVCGSPSGCCRDGPSSSIISGRSDMIDEDMLQCIESGASSFAERDSAFGERALATLDILSRYSVMAMFAVTLIVMSGIFNAGCRVIGSFGKLFDTSYGEVLIIKIGCVAVMLALAFFNRFILMPVLRTASFNSKPPVSTLRMSVAFELTLGIVTLGAAAILGITPPPR